MMRQVGVVLRKELLDNLRDRRSLSTALMMPVLGPIMFLAMFTAFSRWMDQDKPLNVAVAGAEQAPNLISYLEQNGAIIVQAGADPEAQVRAKEADIALVIPPEYGEDIEAGRPARVRLIFDESRNSARTSVERTRRLLRTYAQQIAALRLVARGISPTLAAPVLIEEHDVTTSQQRAAVILGMIPLFLLMSVVIGGMYVAIDSTAGERERGSLEPLLINPVSRRALATGKWLAVVIFSWIPFPLSLVLFKLALAHVPLHLLGIRANLGVEQIAWMLVILLPLTLATAALQMLVATFARSFKEAQNYVSVFLTVAVLPPSMSFLLDRELSWMQVVPILAHHNLLMAVMRHEPVQPAALALATGVAVALAAVCLAAIIRLLGKEQIVFGR